MKSRKLVLTPRLANLLTVLGLLAFYAAVTFTAPRWARLFGQSSPVAEEEPGDAAGGEVPAAAPGPPAAAAAAGAEAQSTINVKLFFEGADRPGLVLEQREVPYSPDLGQQLRAVVEELIRGSRQGLLSPLDPATRVLDVFVTARGVAYVDLSQEASRGHTGGTGAELLSVYAVVNSLVENFPAVRRVQILVEDRPVATLAGHVDLSRPLPADMTLLAPLEARPLSEAPAPAAPAGERGEVGRPPGA